MSKALMLFKFICPAILILTTQVLEQPNLYATSPPKPPSTGTPKGNSTPGTTRPEVMCKQTNKPLTALNANNGSDFTVSANPSFWFYIPYTQEDIKHAEFLLLDGRGLPKTYVDLEIAAKKWGQKKGLKNLLRALSPRSAFSPRLFQMKARSRFFVATSHGFIPWVSWASPS